MPCPVSPNFNYIPTHTNLRSVRLLDWVGRVCRSGIESLKRVREQHGDPLTVGPVLIAEDRNQVAFLKLYAQQDVGCCRACEKQMSVAHVRRRPEGDQEAQ